MRCGAVPHIQCAVYVCVFYVSSYLKTRVLLLLLILVLVFVFVFRFALLLDAAYSKSYE